MANPAKGEFDLGRLVDSFNTANQATTDKLNALSLKTNVNVADYMQLQVQMNQLSQIGQLITSTVGAVNHMVQTAIQGFQSR